MKYLEASREARERRRRVGAPIPDNDVLYLQVRCPDGIDSETGEKIVWRGRPWLLKLYLTDGEVVRTAFMAVMAAIEHEAREQFLYKGAAVCNPHFDV